MHTADTPATDIYGLLAEFRNADELAVAARRAYEAGYRRLDAFSPVPIEGLAEAMGHKDTWVQKICLGGAIAGGLFGFGLATITSAYLYPLNIGGRPLVSWPSFIVPTFETTILFASFSAAIGMLALNGLPQPYHPVFNVEAFRRRASSSGYFLCIEADDPTFDRLETRKALESFGALEVNDVAH
jgi:hypothetical protein